MSEHRRPWGSVKHLISVCHKAGMTVDEISFGTGLTKNHIRWTAKQLKITLRNPNKPLIKYYVQSK